MSPDSTIKCKKCGSAERYKNGQCAPCRREYSRNWQVSNPEKHRENNRKWYHANSDKYRKWARANPEKCREYRRKWAYANPEKIRINIHRRRVHKLGNKSESYDFKAICAHYDNCCVKCGEKKPLTIDHIQPISKGGSNITSNIQPLCGRCNSIKGTKIIDYRPDAGPLRWIQNKLFGG